MHSTQNRNTVLMVVVAALMSSSGPLNGQTTGSIRGVVRDARGATVPSATVMATAAAGAVRSVLTNADGQYSITELPAGIYTVSVTSFGFRGATRTDVEVRGAVVVDLVLEPLRVDAINVTAMLRDQELHDVPFSIAAPSAQVLRSRGVEDIEGIAANVAGFSVQNLGPAQSQVAMRGASAGQIARDQPGVKEQVGAYLDDTPISLSLFTPDLDLFDVSRVEVLRGPQGTLFGAGSLAGTVRYITNQPEPGRSSVFGEVGASQMDGGSAGGLVRAGANVPLGGSAAVRAVGWYTRFGGWMDAVQPGLSIEEDVNSGNRYGGRVALRFDAGDRLTITPRVVYQRLEMDGWNRIDAFNILANPYTTTRPTVTLGERQLYTQIEEPTTDELVIADVNVTYRIGSTSVASITSYTARDILVTRDATALTASITGGTIGLPENIYTIDAPLYDATDVGVLTQELRLAGAAGRVRWLTGAFYSRVDRDYAQTLRVAGFETASSIGTQGLRAGRDELYWSELTYDLSQFALFGEATLGVTDRLDVTGGIRYYNFDEDRDQVFDGLFVHDDLGTAVVSVPGSIGADGFAPRGIVSFRVSPQITLNAQASRGFRLGGINDPINEPLCTPADLVTFGGRDTWRDETAWNYEVGAKTRLLNGRATFNLSAFHMDIRDLQLNVTAGTCSSRLVFNVPRARSQGLEAEFTAAPSERFDIAVSGAVNNASLRSTVTSTDEEGNVSVVSGIESGNRLPSVPRTQVAAAATYRVPIRAGSLAYITGSYQHIGSRYTQIDDLVPGIGTVPLTTFEENTIGGPLTETTFRFDPELPAYNLANVRVGYMRERWELAVFVNNITDERALLALDRERGLLARVGYLTNPPRTAGATLRFTH